MFTLFVTRLLFSSKKQIFKYNLEIKSKTSLHYLVTENIKKLYAILSCIHCVFKLITLIILHCEYIVRVILSYINTKLGSVCTDAVQRSTQFVIAEALQWFRHQKENHIIMTFTVLL